jgi:hypothetical protein
LPGNFGVWGKRVKSIPASDASKFSPPQLRNPELESLFSRKRVSLEAQSEKPDRDAIEAATGWNRSQFDIGDLGGDDEDQTARFRATKTPRKPLNLQNPKKK